MISWLNQIRFTLLATHQRLHNLVRQLFSLKAVARLALALLLFSLTNWNSFRVGGRRQAVANWNGADYLTLDQESTATLQQLSQDTGAIVEVYSINYRTPGHYEGIWGSSGHPRNRYAARDFQWVEMQRSECGETPIDQIESRTSLELFCPLPYGTLSLPVGFVTMRWKGGALPDRKGLEPLIDRLWDVGRLISR